MTSEKKKKRKKKVTSDFSVSWRTDSTEGKWGLMRGSKNKKYEEVNIRLKMKTRFQVCPQNERLTAVTSL